MEGAFEKEEVIDWKQGAGINVGDTVKRYDRKKFTFKILNDEYGIFTVRGPRSVPNSLRCALEE